MELRNESIVVGTNPKQSEKLNEKEKSNFKEVNQNERFVSGQFPQQSGSLINNEISNANAAIRNPNIPVTMPLTSLSGEFPQQSGMLINNEISNANAAIRNPNIPVTMPLTSLSGEFPQQSGMLINNEISKANAATRNENITGSMPQSSFLSDTFPQRNLVLSIANTENAKSNAKVAIKNENFVSGSMPLRNLTNSEIEKPINERSQDDDDDECGSGWGYWLEYLMVLLVAFILLLGCVFLVLFWCFYYRKGYNSWKVERAQQFNLHPTLMVGAVTFTGFSVLMYRIGRCSRRLYVKLLHATFHLLAILCFVGGFLSIFEWHNMISLPHFYSLHSWIGFITMGLFGIQFFVGFVSFLVLLCCESATAGFRACLLPLHTTFGLTIFLISIATCLTGLVQRTNSTIGEDYVSLPEEAIVINALGVALVAVGVAVTYALGRTSLRVKSDCYVSERL